jgi:pyruvate dehydrogenase E1 component beta subunit
VDTLSLARITQREAIAEALRIEMGRDPNVCIISPRQDSTVTAGLDQLFGADRIVALDPAERTALGAAVGMALEGWRPVCEVSASELPSRGLDQLAEAAELHRREGLSVPIVVRVLCGSEESAADPDGPERWLLSIPDLSVVAPATPADAKGLLASAIRDPSPICVLEQTNLNDEMAAVPEGGYVVPIGKSETIREGQRATVLAYGASVAPARRAALELGAEVEVLDLRTLAPLDVDAVVKSVRRTGKALVLEETPAVSTVARILTAAVWEGAFQHLAAPVRRLSLAWVGDDVDDREGARAKAVKEACDGLEKLETSFRERTIG